MADPTSEARYLARASPRFREVYASLAEAIHRLFPDAEALFESRMPGWRIPRRRRVDPATVKGPLDPNWVQVHLVERKSGITLHLWNPADLNAFRYRKAELERAGFKLLVNSIQFNRKSAYPTDLVVSLLEDVKKSLEQDAARGAEEAKAGVPVTAPAGAQETKDEALRRQLDEWASEPPMDGGD